MPANCQSVGSISETHLEFCIDNLIFHPVVVMVFLNAVSLASQGPGTAVAFVLWGSRSVALHAN